MEQEHKRDRLELVENMLKKNPKDVFLNYAAALEYLKRERIEKAQEFFSRVIEIDKNYVPAYYQLGKIYEQHDQVSKAIVTYQKGRTIASKQDDQKTLGELTEALMILDEDFDGSL